MGILLFRKDLTLRISKGNRLSRIKQCRCVANQWASPGDREGEVQDGPGVREALVDLPVRQFVAAPAAEDVAPLVVESPAEREGVELEKPGHVSRDSVYAEVDRQLWLSLHADQSPLDVDSAFRDEYPDSSLG